MQPIVEMIKRDMAASNGERRPYLSLSGPKNICPAANPIILAVNPNCTNEGVVLKYAPIEGRLGRYMSVTNGPNAVNIPNRMRRKSLEFLFLLCMLIIFFLFVFACSVPTFIFQPLYNLPVLTAAVRFLLLQSMHLIMLCP